MKIQKGDPGYIKAQKQKLLMYTIAEFAIVIAVFVLGITQTGSRLNLLTVVAVVGCLPASKMLVEFIAIAPYKSITPERFKEIEEKAKLLTRAYDLVITSKEKIMPVDAVVLSGSTVCGFASSVKTDEVKTAAYMKEMLRKNHLDKVTVKIFHDYKAFITRAEGMNNIASVDPKENRKKEQAVKKLILTISM